MEERKTDATQFGGTYTVLIPYNFGRIPVKSTEGADRRFAGLRQFALIWTIHKLPTPMLSANLHFHHALTSELCFDIEFGRCASLNPSFRAYVKKESQAVGHEMENSFCIDPRED